MTPANGDLYLLEAPVQASIHRMSFTPPADWFLCPFKRVSFLGTSSEQKWLCLVVKILSFVRYSCSKRGRSTVALSECSCQVYIVPNIRVFVAGNFFDSVPGLDVMLLRIEVVNLLVISHITMLHFLYSYFLPRRSLGWGPPSILSNGYLGLFPWG